MTKCEKQWWEKERAKGRDRYLLRAVLRAGLPFGILMLVGKILISALSHQPLSPAWRLFVEFGFYVLGFGGLMGVWTWQDKERDYKKPTEDDDTVA
jgi:hypothetical protein